MLNDGVESQYRNRSIEIAVTNRSPESPTSESTTSESTTSYVTGNRTMLNPLAQLLVPARSSAPAAARAP
ncbi:MAG: hypothetical protein ACRYGL_10500, partial [Janthinobacterium lividum]